MSRNYTPPPKQFWNAKIAKVPFIKGLSFWWLSEYHCVYKKSIWSDLLVYQLIWMIVCVGLIDDEDRDWKLWEAESHSGIWTFHTRNSVKSLKYTFPLAQHISKPNEVKEVYLEFINQDFWWWPQSVSHLRDSCRVLMLRSKGGGRLFYNFTVVRIIRKRN